MGHKPTSRLPSVYRSVRVRSLPRRLGFPTATAYRIEADPPLPIAESCRDREEFMTTQNTGPLAIITNRQLRLTGLTRRDHVGEDIAAVQTNAVQFPITAQDRIA